MDIVNSLALGSEDVPLQLRQEDVDKERIATSFECYSKEKCVVMSNTYHHIQPPNEKSTKRDCPQPIIIKVLRYVTRMISSIHMYTTNFFISTFL